MNYLKAVKQNSFIYNYLQYCNRNLETPTSFDFWSAIWIISMMINRKIKISRPNNPLYPNFYITFIADSGICRKSTAINFARTILHEICKDTADFHIIDTKSSDAKFIYELNVLSMKENQCIIGINCPEFITFFKNKTIIETFIDFYDCPERREGYGTFAYGDISLRNMFVSTLTGSTPNYYFKAVNKEEIEGGFTSRNIIVAETKGKRRIPWGEQQSTDKLIESGRKLAEFIRQKHGFITDYTKEAIRFYSSWYRRRKLSTDLYSRTFESREHDYVLKLATILAINEQNTVIDIQHIKNSIKIVQEMKKNASSFFNTAINSTDKDNMNKTIDKILRVIATYGQNGVKHRDLYLRVHNSCTSDEYVYIINVLHELDLIEKLQPYGSKAVIYRITEKYTNEYTDINQYDLNP